jgi:hypothetical protein
MFVQFLPNFLESAVGHGVREASSHSPFHFQIETLLPLQKRRRDDIRCV